MTDSPGQVPQRSQIDLGRRHSQVWYAPVEELQERLEIMIYGEQR